MFELRQSPAVANLANLAVAATLLALLAFASCGRDERFVGGEACRGPLSSCLPPGNGHYVPAPVPASASSSSASSSSSSSLASATPTPSATAAPTPSPQPSCTPNNSHANNCHTRH